MIQQIKNKLLILGLFLMFALSFAPATVYAGHGGGHIIGGVCKGADELKLTTGDQGDTCDINTTGSTSGVNSLIRRIINIISVIVGIVAVIMIIFAGFRYITSGGKQESVSAAKNTILYAVIGLVIVALAQVIVRFVLSASTGAAS